MLRYSASIIKLCNQGYNCLGLQALFEIFFMATNKTKGRDDCREKNWRGFCLFVIKFHTSHSIFYSITLFYDGTLNATALEKFLPYNRLKLKNIKVYGNNSSNYNCLSIPEICFFVWSYQMFNSRPLHKSNFIKQNVKIQLLTLLASMPWKLAAGAITAYF